MEVEGGREGGWSDCKLEQHRLLIVSSELLKPQIRSQPGQGQGWAGENCQLRRVESQLSDQSQPLLLLVCNIIQ